MRIRKLKITDYDEILKLWTRANLPAKPKGRDTEEAMEKQMEASPDFFLGAFEGNRLIGVVMVSSDLRKGWINRLAVDPGYRHHGVAKALISECESVLRKYGIRIFCALIEDDNDSSKKLFRKCGYVEHHDIIYFSKRESDDV